MNVACWPHYGGRVSQLASHLENIPEHNQIEAEVRTSAPLGLTRCHAASKSSSARVCLLNFHQLEHCPVQACFLMKEQTSAVF
jgi:hypothetical protein